MTQEELNLKYEVLAKEHRLLPIKVPPFYQAKVQEEISALGEIVGPLCKAVYPTAQKLTLRSPREVPDFVDDRLKMPADLEGIAIRKYDDRLLFLTTSRCFGHCQYCFRQDILADTCEKREHAQLPERVHLLMKYLQKHTEINEVILSGGDPMTLGVEGLKLVIDSIRSVSEHVAVRIHTRSLAFAPEVYSTELVNFLGEHRIRLVGHFVHPYEICDIVRAKLNTLRCMGVRLYNQFPLIHGINDHPIVLAELLRELDQMGMRTISMFIPDPICYSASYRIPLQRLWKILDQLNHSTPSWINSVRVVFDSPIGKVRREELVRYNINSGAAVFERGGKIVEYPDLPDNMYEESAIQTLLWKHKTVK